MGEAPGELVHHRVRGAVAELTLDVPATRNALSTAVLEQLLAALAAASADPAVRSIVLTHAGPVFSSGIDTGPAGAAAVRVDAAGRAASEAPVMVLARVFEAITTCPKPVTARVAGPARAAGVGLLAACDIVVASSDADFAVSEVRLGLVPAVVTLTLRARLAGHTLRELLLTGEVVNADRAAAIGLVNSVVAPAALDTEVRRYQEMLTAGGPQALAATKAMLAGRTTVSWAGPDHAGAGGSVNAADLAALSARHFAGAEGREGMAARRERRAPSWVSGTGGPA